MVIHFDMFSVVLSE